jgi:hypothetical protein
MMYYCNVVNHIIAHHDTFVVLRGLWSLLDVGQMEIHLKYVARCFQGFISLCTHDRTHRFAWVDNMLGLND